LPQGERTAGNFGVGITAELDDRELLLLVLVDGLGAERLHVPLGCGGNVSHADDDGVETAEGRRHGLSAQDE